LPLVLFSLSAVGITAAAVAAPVVVAGPSAVAMVVAAPNDEHEE
jgi:hypothetical protein